MDIEKIKNLQIMRGGRITRRPAEDVFIPPEPGKLGIIIPSGGIIEQKEMEYLVEAEMEKRDNEKRPLPHTKPVNIERRPGGTVIIDDGG